LPGSKSDFLYHVPPSEENFSNGGADVTQSKSFNILSCWFVSLDQIHGKNPIVLDIAQNSVITPEFCAFLNNQESIAHVIHILTVF
jgi:hypothetical protein